MRGRLACACVAALTVALAPRAVCAQHLEASGGGTVTVGDTVTIDLRATLPDGASIAGDPHPRDSLPNSVRLLGMDTLPRAADGAHRYRARIAFFQTGSLTSPAFALPYRRAGAEVPDSVVSGAVLVTVDATLPDTAVAMRDIRPIASLGGSTGSASRWWLVLVAALLVAAAAAIALRARPRPRIAIRAAPADLPLGAYEAARARLRALGESDLAARDVARFYDEVTDTLRRYLEAAYHIPAVHRTTPELLRTMPISLAGHARAAGALLGEADLVKFARLRPDAYVARAFAARAADVLESWHDAGTEELVATGTGAPDALR
ncbi:MAG TPA: hypothetical protein VF118_15320 [Gemmatimonadaceae bacterium]